MLGRTDRRLRLIALLGVFVLVAGSLGARLGYWTLARSSYLSARALQQLEHTQTSPAQRGPIYDRSGTVLLATTAYRNLLSAYPAQLTADQADAMTGRLAAILKLDAAGAAALHDQLAGGAPYAVLARQLTDAQSEQVRQGLADGSLVQLNLEPQPIRVYPDPGGAPSTTLASQLLGFVNAAGQGQYGVEQHYQQLLAGSPRVTTGLVDIAGQPMADAQQVVDAGQPGASLRLTIDAGLQLQLEKELYTAWVADGASSASAVVLDPTDGSVLAWASVPGYDDNAYAQVAASDPGRFVDPIVSKVYEPGSVMKMFVAAAGFQSGKLTPTQRFNDSGSMRIDGYTIYDSDHRPMGMLRFEDGVAYSRNIVATRAAMTLGKGTEAAATVLYNMWQTLGVGRTTGVDVAGEVPGIAANPAVQPWAAIDLANRSFGQGVAVTLLQLASSYATMANGGWTVQPHVVAAVDGRPVAQPPRRQVLSTAVSAELQALMVHVVTAVPFYRAGTHIPGYIVGGKTGTAQIWDPRHNDWLPNTFDQSFVGFVGQSRPQAIIAVRLSHVVPKVLGQGVLIYPINEFGLFRRIAIDTIDALGIPPQGTPGPSQAPAPNPGSPLGSAPPADARPTGRP